MRKTIVPIPLAMAASLLLAACGSSSYGGGSAGSSSSSASSSAPAETAGALVRTATNGSLGETVLVDGSGMTLYALSGERAGHFICSTSACTSVWHPLAAGQGATPATPAGLGSVKRPDGTMQVTYQGKPLYTFARDRTAGQAAGQGLKDVGTWSAVATAVSSSPEPGSAPASPESAPSSSSSEPSGGGYKY